MEHVVIVVGLASKEPVDGDLGSFSGCCSVLEDGRRGVRVWLESEESLGSVGMEVGPPDGKDPRMGTSFDEALGDP